MGTQGGWVKAKHITAWILLNKQTPLLSDRPGGWKGLPTIQPPHPIFSHFTMTVTVSAFSGFCLCGRSSHIAPSTQTGCSGDAPVGGHWATPGFHTTHTALPTSCASLGINGSGLGTTNSCGLIIFIYPNGTMLSISRTALSLKLPRNIASCPLCL